MHAPFGKFETEQMEALDTFKSYFEHMRFKTQNGNKFRIIMFQTGALIHISALKSLYHDLKTVYGINSFLAINTTQDDLERYYSRMRGDGSSFILYPDSLEFKRRMEHELKIKFLEDEPFNLLGRKSELKITNEFDAKFEIDPNTPLCEFSDLEEEGMKKMADDVVCELNATYKITVETLLPDLKKIYSFFVASHPKDSLLDGKFKILSGKVNETKAFLTSRSHSHNVAFWYI